MRRLAWVPALALAAGCSLPLPSGVSSPANVETQRRPAGLQVLPQGPTAGQSQTAVVAGFIAAQASPAGDYAIARQFLTGDAARTWSPSAGLRVFAPDTERVQLLSPKQETSVQVQLTALGDVDAAGHFVRSRRPANDFYGVTKVREGWRISSIPRGGQGLQLSLVDLLRTLPLRNVYYLAPRVAGATGRHLVPDRVFLRDAPDVDGLTALVRRAFAPPSVALAGSVDPLPSGLQPLDVHRSRDGVVTLELPDAAGALPAEDLRDLSARLVWTLRSDPLFTGLRLTTRRGALRLQGSEVQPAAAWPDYDPDGLGTKPAYFFVSGKRLRAAGTTLPSSPLTAPAPAGVPVDAVAVAPRGGRVAALHRTGSQVAVEVGSLSSSVVASGPRAAGLSSPTWGSGEIGLWMLRGTTEVVRTDVTGTGPLQVVAFPGRPAGRLRSLALSRDGTRAALVVEHGLYVAKVVWHGDAPALVGATLVTESHGVPRQVAWSTPTDLVLLQPDQGASAVLRVAVDGSASATVLLGSLSPRAVASAGQVLLVANRDGALYSVSRGITKEQVRASAPTFPG